MNCNYLEKFAEAYIKTSEIMNLEDIEPYQYFKESWDGQYSTICKEDTQKYIEVANEYFETLKRVKDLDSLVNSCHKISQNFVDLISSLDSYRKPVFITIGNVKLDGKELFEIDYGKLEKRFNDGIKSKDPVDFHVWVTLPDLTIIDMTLQASIISELPNVDIQDCRIIIDKDGSRSSFDFEPLFIHPNIMSLID